MTMTAREAFEKGTATFNAHDIDGFAEVLADDVVFKVLGGSARRLDDGQLRRGVCNSQISADSRLGSRVSTRLVGA